MKLDSVDPTIAARRVSRAAATLVTWPRGARQARALADGSPHQP